MTDWASSYVQANGVRFHYTRTGGDKPPLLMAHGITGSGLCWQRPARDLQADYDLLMVDARGHGLSEAPEDGYTWTVLGDDLAAVIRALGLQHLGIFGQSMGAQTAAAVAAQYPELVDYLILEDPPWGDGFPTPDERGARRREFYAHRVAGNARAVEDLLADLRAEYPDWDEADLLPLAESEHVVNPRVAGIMAAFMPAWRLTCRRITCPTLLLTGEPACGAIMSPEDAEMAAGLMRQGRVMRIAGAGHCVHRDRYEPVMAAINAFLQQCG
ncbi:MAG: alpha/beta fold hydrolase [Anaerolineae bacterium]